jgi:hypothetical protein
MQLTGLVVIAALILVSSLAEGANWARVAESENGNVNFIDVDSMQREGASVRYLRKMILLNDIEVKEAVAYEEVDCSEKKFRILRGTNYLHNGNPVSSTTIKEWTYITPDSVIEVFYEFVCKSDK